MHDSKINSDELNFTDFLSIIYEEPREVPQRLRSSRGYVGVMGCSFSPIAGHIFSKKDGGMISGDSSTI